MARRVEGLLGAYGGRQTRLTKSSKVLYIDTRSSAACDIDQYKF